jgi:ABC-type sugar transport system permease subunit
MALVSNELLEATRIDGGNWWSEIRYVMLPAMRPILTLIVILRVIWTFNFFDLVYLMTGGGPNNSTMVLPVMMYQMLFQSFQIGLAAAIGTLMVVVLGVFAFVLLWHRARTER